MYLDDQSEHSCHRLEIRVITSPTCPISHKFSLDARRGIINGGDDHAGDDCAHSWPL